MPKDQPFHRVLIVGLGEREKFEPHRISLATPVPRCAISGGAMSSAIAIALPDEAKGNETACASFAAEGAVSGAFETTIYQEKPDKRMAIESATILDNGFDSTAVKAGVERGTILGEAVNFARRLAITPANEMTPTHLADEAIKAREDRRDRGRRLRRRTHA